jgi:hypothetical protein
MKIFIPTLGRIGKIKTLEFIPDNWVKDTYLICPIEEVEAHKQVWPNVIANPLECKGIGKVRQFITYELADMLNTDKVCMLDDDHQFFKRFDWESPRLTRIDKAEMNNLLHRISELLDTYAHIGLSYRLGNNTMKLPYEENTRYTSSHAHRPSVLKKHHIRWDAVPLQEDFHVNLSLLKLGYENRVITEYAYNEFRAANADGGCSTYRTYELQRQARDKLVELHDPFVKPVEKWTEFTSMLNGSPAKQVIRPETINRKKTGRMVETTMYGRPESHIYWKKAYESSQSPKKKGFF